MSPAGTLWSGSFDSPLQGSLRMTLRESVLKHTIALWAKPASWCRRIAPKRRIRFWARSARSSSIDTPQSLNGVSVCGMSSQAMRMRERLESDKMRVCVDIGAGSFALLRMTFLSSIVPSAGSGQVFRPSSPPFPITVFILNFFVAVRICTSCRSVLSQSPSTIARISPSD